MQSLTAKGSIASMNGDIYYKKPCELRSLWIDTSRNEQGKLEMWVDIMDQATASKYPPVDVSKPPAEKFELRVVVWKVSFLLRSFECSFFLNIF